MIFTPVLDNGTNLLTDQEHKGITGPVRGGLAYELSPSFDIRAEYRGLLVKTPNFGQGDFSTTGTRLSPCLRSAWRTISSCQLSCAPHLP